MGVILRILLIGIAIWFVYRLVRKVLNKSALERDAQNSVEQEPHHELMVKCSFCQTHIPQGESTQSKGHYFCSEAHRNAFLNHQK